MIQKETIRKINVLREYLNTLLPYTTLPDKDLLSNLEKLSTMERYFILMADEAFDVNSALAYQLGDKIPESNKSTFYEIVDLDIISREFADKISLSAKTRNQLVHNYEEVQKSMLVKEMKKFAELYKEYIKILIEKFVTKDKNLEK
ncbi:MAG: hypothetical protein CEO19_74 [Parcubacteria group bacterium Gr01-1014_73]|nr:MAG: hypothetical protein CEO19_74 [Parcubacteria group bacterium Gr01-1014_73]